VKVVSSTPWLGVGKTNTRVVFYFANLREHSLTHHSMKLAILGKVTSIGISS